VKFIGCLDTELLMSSRSYTYVGAQSNANAFMDAYPDLDYMAIAGGHMFMFGSYNTNNLDFRYDMDCLDVKCDNNGGSYASNGVPYCGDINTRWTSGSGAWAVYERLGHPYQIPQGADGWCAHSGAIHQDTPSCGRVCSDRGGWRGVKNQGTWSSTVQCSACPEAQWSGC